MLQAYTARFTTDRMVALVHGMARAQLDTAAAEAALAGFQVFFLFSFLLFSFFFFFFSFFLCV